MRSFTLIKLGIAVTVACIITAGFILFHSDDQYEMESRDVIPRNRKYTRPTDQSHESIFQKRVRSSKLDLQNLDETMDFIDEMIGDDTYPSDATAAKAKLHSDLDFILSLGWSHQQITCITNISKNFTRDAMISAKDPADYLARISMFDELIHEFGDKVNYEQLMQTVASQTTKELLHLTTASYQDYQNTMSSALSGGDRQAEVASRILGEIMAKTLGKEPSTAITYLAATKDPLLRLGTEKALLRNGNIDTTTKQIFAAYYLSNDCQLPHDAATEKNLFGLGIKYDPETISSIISDAPSSPKRDFAIEHLVYRAADDDPERSKLWLELIEDPNVKARAEKYLHGNK